MDDITIHPNKYLISTSEPKKKHFIFDLDETLGSFSDMYLLWKGIEFCINNQKRIHDSIMDQTVFNFILNLYPEFLRYGITTILEYLYHKKQKKQCGNVYIYTNNQCDPPWVEQIVSYFENQFNLNGLFEKPICAFKINNKTIDTRRTSHEKSYKDFLKCTLLSKTAELCFIDDTYFPKMQNDQVFYVQPKQYQHCLGTIEIINRFVTSEINKRCFLLSYDDLLKWFVEEEAFKPPIKTRLEKEIDVEISRKLMYIIREFFYMILKKEKTKRNRSFKTQRKFTKKRSQKI
jgi:hypothetical protein